MFAEGRIRLTDFGLKDASFETEKFQESSVCDKYSAPEVLFNSKHNFLSDWWSLGILLYELISGVYPFKGFNSEELMESIERKEYKNIEEIPEDFKDLFDKAFISASEDRLGNKGAEDWKFHCVFKGIDWQNLQS